MKISEEVDKIKYIYTRCYRRCRKKERKKERKTPEAMEK